MPDRDAARRAIVSIIRRDDDENTEWGYLGIYDSASNQYRFDIPEKPGYIHCLIENGLSLEYAECLTRVALDPNVRCKFRKYSGVLVAVEFDPLKAASTYGRNAPALGVPSLPLPGRAIYPPPTFGDPVIKLLDAGVASAGDDRFIVLAAEGGTTDDCTELQGLNVGDEAWIFADAGDTITLKHNASGATDKFLFYGEADIELSGNQGLRVLKKAAGVVVNSVDAQGAGGSIDAADVSYTPTTSGDWLTLPDDVAEAADELAGRVKAAEDNAVESFTDLDDVPSSYSGQAGKFVVVNGGETALEFVTAAAGSVGAKLRHVGTIIYSEVKASSGTFNTGTLPTGYDSYEVRLRLRSTVSNTNDVAYLRFNNDTTATNYRNALSGSSSGSASNGVVNNPRIAICPGATSPTGSFGITKVRISEPEGSKLKTSYSEDAAQLDSTTLETIYNHMHFWNSTSAITSIQVVLDGSPTDTFAAGSSITVIGWKEETIGGLDTSDANVSNPPTDAELDSAFGTPAAVGDGFMATVNDNGADTAQWLVVSNGASWWYVGMTKAV